MAFNIGVNVLEVDGRSVPGIVAAPTSVGGFLVRSQRGVPNQPTRVQGLGDYADKFGSPQPGLYGSHAVRGFFDNGGSQAYVVRVVASGGSNPARAASVTLNDANGTATLRVAAGQRGREDPGAWGNALAVQIANHPRGNSGLPAQIVGANVEPFALVAGQTLELTLNGATTPVTVTFNAADFSAIGAASAAEVAAVINRQAPGVRAAVSPDRRVLLASTQVGGTARVAVTAGAAATALGFTGATANTDGPIPGGSRILLLQSTGGFLSGSSVRIETAGHVIGGTALGATTNIAANSGFTATVNGGTPQTIVFQATDFVDPANATRGEIQAAINRQSQAVQPGFTAALTSDNRLVLMSNTYGTGSTIALSAPGGGVTNAITTLGLNGATPNAGTRSFGTVDLVSEGGRYVRLSAGLPAAGLAENVARVQSAEFDIVVLRRNALTGQFDEVERFESASMQNGLNYYATALVNDPFAGSRYITVTDLNSASAAGQDAPAENRNAAGQLLPFPLGASAATTGQDGGTPADIDYLGDPAARTGLYAFDTVDIQLLACPETTSSGVVAGSLAYCEGRGDAMFIGTAPFGRDLQGIKDYAAPFRARKVFGALYAPWIQIINPVATNGSSPLLSIPPVGHVMGMYARIAEARGVWKAPAGDEAQLANALGVEFDMTDVDHTDLVRNGSVNGIRAIPGSGIIVDASRTLSTDTRWLFVNVRRLFNFVKVSLRDSLRWVAQEPHSDELRRSVKFNVVTPFLLGLWRQGAFGSDPPEQVFTVICDETNNPPAEVNQGNFRLEVYFYPVKPAETIIIVVGQQESTASAGEA